MNDKIMLNQKTTFNNQFSISVNVEYVLNDIINSIPFYINCHDNTLFIEEYNLEKFIDDIYTSLLEIFNKNQNRLMHNFQFEEDKENEIIQLSKVLSYLKQVKEENDKIIKRSFLFFLLNSLFINDSNKNLMTYSSVFTYSKKLTGFNIQFNSLMNTLYFIHLVKEKDFIEKFLEPDFSLSFIKFKKILTFI